MRRPTWSARVLGAVIAVAMATAGCKSKAKEAAGTGSASASGSVAISIPGGDASAYTAKVEAPTVLPAEIQERLAGTYDVLKTVTLGPDGTQLPAPAIVTVTIDNLPAGRQMSDVVAALVSSDGSVEDARIVAVHGNDVQVEVPHFSILTMGVAVGLIVVTAGLAFALRGGSDPIMKKDCARFIDPTNPEVAVLAGDPSKFAVDPTTGDIKLDLGKPLKGKDVDQGAHQLTVDKVIAKGEGDCVNMSTLFGSLLAAKKYPVRQVSGTATYDRNGKTYKGGHQWVEVVIDRKTYYVDTFEPSQPKLIPIDEARSELNLKRGRMCSIENGTEKYDPKWFEVYETDPLEAKRQELEKLMAKHRALHEECKGGKNDACTDRQKTYEKAKALQEEINAAEAAAKTP